MLKMQAESEPPAAFTSQENALCCLRSYTFALLKMTEAKTGHSHQDKNRWTIKHKKLK